MTLGEAIERLEELDDDATIYAARPWVEDAQAMVVVEPEVGFPKNQVAGLEYFLEVDAAVEAATVSNAGTRFERVLHHAEKDGYLFES